MSEIADQVKKFIAKRKLVKEDDGKTQGDSLMITLNQKQNGFQDDKETMKRKLSSLQRSLHKGEDCQGNEVDITDLIKQQENIFDQINSVIECKKRKIEVAHTDFKARYCVDTFVDALPEELLSHVLSYVGSSELTDSFCLAVCTRWFALNKSMYSSRFHYNQFLAGKYQRVKDHQTEGTDIDDEQLFLSLAKADKKWVGSKRYFSNFRQVILTPDDMVHFPNHPHMNEQIIALHQSNGFLYSVTGNSSIVQYNLKSHTHTLFEGDDKCDEAVFGNNGYVVIVEKLRPRSQIFKFSEVDDNHAGPIVDLEEELVVAICDDYYVAHAADSVADGEAVASLYDLRTFEELFVLDGVIFPQRAGFITAGDKQYLFTCQAEYTQTQLWDVKARERFRGFGRSFSHLDTINFAADQHNMALFTYDREVEVFNLETKKRGFKTDYKKKAKCTVEEIEVTRLARIALEGNKLITFAGDNRKLILRDLRSSDTMPTRIRFHNMYDERLELQSLVIHNDLLFTSFRDTPGFSCYKFSA